MTDIDPKYKFSMRTFSTFIEITLEDSKFDHHYIHIDKYSDMVKFDQKIIEAKLQLIEREELYLKHFVVNK